MPSFTSEIFIIGVNPYVPVSDDVLAHLFDAANKVIGPIPVKGTLCGKPFIQTVVKYAGLWRLYLNGVMIKGTGLSVGDSATLEIEYDSRSREEKIPEHLEAIFETDIKAKEIFLMYPPYRQKEILRYLNNLKTDEALMRNIKKVKNHLHGKKEDLIVLTYDRSRKL